LGTNKVIISRDVVFNENSIFKQTDFEKIFELKSKSYGETNSIDLSHEKSEIEYEEQKSIKTVGVSEPVINISDKRRSQRVNKGKPPERYGNLVSYGKLAESAYTASEPSSWKEAIVCNHSEMWIEAAKEEIDSLLKNETWELCELPKGKEVIGCKWVFKVKEDEKGNIKRYKARLVAKGYTQKYGIDFEETFAPVAKFTTIRTLLTIAAMMDLEIKQMGVKTAFLYGEMQEEAYMEQPEGFVIPGKEHLVCKLRKSIYGLKQAPRMWNSTIHKFFIKNGFKQCQSDWCLYVQTVEKVLFVLIYVDDLIIASSNTQAIEKLKNDMSKIFSMTDLGELNYFLGIEIIRIREKKSILLSQKRYIMRLLKRFHMQESKPAITPIEFGYKFQEKSEEKSQNEKIPYREIVGSLMYAMVCTRRDIAASVGILSRYMNNFTHSHFKAAKRVLRYLNGTRDFALMLKPENEALIGYSDADWGGNTDDRKSTSGYLFQLGGSSLSWNSKKQQTVALSSTEAEYMALSTATQECVWLRNLLQEIGFKQEMPTTIFEVNQACIKLTKSTKNYARTKHIDIRHHFIREKVDSGL
ncbi:polyprotein-like protein, partial [Dinothrombium tinctorium]